MADPLQWKEGEGYDLHVLRGGPPSKSLIDAFDLPVDAATASLTFTALFEGAPSAHSVAVDFFTGSVVASLRTDATKPPLNNFLVAVLFVDSLDPQGREFRTEFRVYVHDTVQKIWLTPGSLTSHLGADENRFTVLATFNDGVVGDVTDWEALQYQSDAPSVVAVNSRGTLSARSTSGTASITARLQLISPSLNLAAPPVRALAGPSWSEMAAAAKFSFVAGPCVPRASDPNGAARDSVQNVVERATNVLFVAEGFRQDQRGDFNNLVATAVNDLRSKNYLEPYPLLKRALNYWSVFLPSEEAGVTELADHAYDGSSFTGQIVPPLARAPQAATAWTLPQMLREVGWPILSEVEIPWLPDHVLRWRKLYGAHVTEGLTRAAYPGWFNLALRTLLNERSSAFGLAMSDRPRAEPTTRLQQSLRFDYRRTSEASLMAFVHALKYGGYPVGDKWKEGSWDFGLVCFVCLSDKSAGQARIGGGYFTAATGRGRLAKLEPDPSSGWHSQVSPVRKHSRAWFTSLVSHECSHVFGLWDEYGDGLGSHPGSGAAHVSDSPNVEEVAEISSLPPSGSTFFDKLQRLKWNWPRLTKAGIISGLPERSPTGYHLELQPGHGARFSTGDSVKFRQWPVTVRQAQDPLVVFHQTSGLVFRVLAQGADSVDLVALDATGQPVDVDHPRPGQADPRSWTDILHALLSSDANHALVCPHTLNGAELSLVAPVVFNHIVSSNGPLNAPKLQPTAACVSAQRYDSSMTPTNLPALTRGPRVKADVVGLYEGASYHDCGLYRPAGRCKMRTTETVIPFCQVCRYLMVDRVDPTRHTELDADYESVYPQG